MKQQDSEQASDHDMPEDDKERMPEKYETVSLDDFVKYNICLLYTSPSPRDS